MIATVHHQNDDLWALGVCFVIGLTTLLGGMELLRLPAVQTFVAYAAHVVSQQVQGALPRLSPAG